MIRELVSEVVGLSPYERRLLDMLKTGGASSEKRMYKFAKRRVSSGQNWRSSNCCFRLNVFLIKNVSDTARNT